ncbi:MAG TPA: hypothetical protein VGN06_02790, partial [Gaiellaceae bacterium]
MAGMRPEDVYELTGVADPRISPDGKRVAYAVWSIDKDSNEYRGAVWVAPLDGSEDPRQFTSGERRDGTPRWSPDGKWLSFVSNRGEEKASANLYVIPSAGGEARRLTDLKESVEGAEWSPDSSRLVITARDRDEAYDEDDDRKRTPRRFRRVFHKLDSVGWTGDRRKHVWIVDLDSTTRMLTNGDFEDDTPAWTPDGKRVVFAALRTPDWDVELLSRLYSVDADGGEPEQLTGDDAACGWPAFSDDGRIAYEWTVEDGTDPHHTQIAVAAKPGAAAKVLTASLDRQCGPYPPIRGPVWNGNRIVFPVEDGGNTHLYSVAADGSSAPQLLVGGERSISGYDVNGDTIAFVSSAHTTLRELFVGERQVTSLTGDRAYCDADRFTAISKDGTEVDAWIMRPPGFELGKKYPTLLSIHGGPFT